MSFRDDLNDLIAPTERVLEGADLVSLETKSPKRRERLYHDIEESEDRFEEEFRSQWRSKLDETTTSEVRGRFATARLFLHVASLRDDRSDALDPNAFTDDEVQAAVDFDHYRAFDVSDEADLKRRIREKDQAVYQFVVEEITTQTEDRSSVLESQHNRIRKEIMDYLNRRYQQRLERSQEAVSMYIQEHGLPNVVEGIEDAVEATADGATTRRDVEEAVRSELDALSERLHATLRDQERAIRSDIATVEGELATGTDDVAPELESKLDAIREDVRAVRDERRADVEAIDAAVDELAVQRDRIEAKIDDLERTSAAAAETAAADAAESVASKAERVVSEEVDRLEARREELDAELSRLNRERERLEATGDRLESEREDLEARVERVSASLPDESGRPEDSTVVPARVARLYELDFISRFEESIQEARTITLPSGERFEPGPDFGPASNESGDERRRMATLLEEQDRETEPVDHFPLRRYSRYTIATGGRFTLRRNLALIVEATVHSNLDAYAENGFDARPAGLDDLLDIVNRATDRAREYGTPHLVAAASTTGWTDRVRDLVVESEFSRTRLGDDVSLCLVDIRTGELLYDRADDVVDANRGLFERAVQVERIDACERHLRDEYLSDPTVETVRMTAVAAELDTPEHVVRSAFDRIASAGDATRRYHDEYGPYLVVDGV